MNVFTEVKGQMGNTAFLTRGVAPCWPADLFTESTALKNSCFYFNTCSDVPKSLYNNHAKKKFNKIKIGIFKQFKLN